MTKKDDFFRTLVKGIDDKNTVTTLASDEENPAEFAGWIDTGVYMLNALISGSLFGGFPDNKVTTLAGESSVGKSLFAVNIAGSWQKKNPEGVVFYYDTEYSITNEMMESFGLDPARVYKPEPTSLEKFRVHIMKLLNDYEKAIKDLDEADRQPMLIVLDSLSQLPTEKELADTESGEVKLDQGLQSRIIKGLFREVRAKLARVRVPMIVTAHVFQAPQQNPRADPTRVSGGFGLQYTSDLILMLRKHKDRDDANKSEVVGNIITCSNFKNRFSKQDARVDVRLSYQHGLDTFYGLIELGEKHGIIQKVGNRYEIAGKKLYRKEIMASPEEYFNQEFLNVLEEAVKKDFKYGATG